MAALAALGQTPLVVTGTATYRERMALPLDAVFEASLEDVSIADKAAHVLRTIRLEKPGNPPFHFSIAYDPAQIVSNHTYSVRARIVEGRKLMFITVQRYAVLTNGHGNEISMMVMQRVSSSGEMSGPAPAAAKTSLADEPLRETYWKLMELNGKPVTVADQQQEAHLVFRTEGNRLTGSGGCNRLMGGYTVTGNAMHFGGIAGTRMACQHGMDTEQAFLQTLDKVKRWKITGKHLEMYDESGAMLARFEARAMK
jgi:putative lipoprotein